MSKVIQVIKPMKGKMEGNTFVAKPKKGLLHMHVYPLIMKTKSIHIKFSVMNTQKLFSLILIIYMLVFLQTKGLSGTQAKKRPEFMKMIESAKMGEIDLILTKGQFLVLLRNTVRYNSPMLGNYG